MESQVLLRALIYFIPFLLSLGVHEWAHAMTATKLGDNTSSFLGRLTLNPFKHADPLGTFLFPLMALLFKTPFFGWAKPVPVNTRHFKNPIRDLAIVAAAGPVSNILLAVFCAIIRGQLAPWAVPYHPILTPLYATCEAAIWVNLFLAFFNLIPLPPLDGSRIIRVFLPGEWLRRFDQAALIAPLLLLFLFFSGALRFLLIPVQISFRLLSNWFM